MAEQQADRLIGGAQQVGCLVLEVAPEVAYAVAAVQRAADDVVQRQAGLAVGDDLRHVRVERRDLIGRSSGTCAWPNLAWRCSASPASCTSTTAAARTGLPSSICCRRSRTLSRAQNGSPLSASLPL